MNRKAFSAIGASTLLAAITLAGCSSAASTPPAPPAGSSTADASAATGATPAASAAPGGVVLPVASNPIVNTATDPTLEITYSMVEDNVDPATGKAIDDRLQLTLKNTGTTPLDGLEVYYEMTDVVTGAMEGYYQKLDGLSIPAGQDATVYFDNKTDPGHYPENQFSIYRSSTNEVDFAIQASAPGAKIATATAVKATGTGEKVD